jgi:hypothetical protein
MEELEEKLSVSGRLKLKRSIKRNKSRIKLGQKRARKRTANTEVIGRRSSRRARAAVTKQVMKGKKKSDLSPAARAAVEKRVDRYKSRINRLKKRFIPKVRKDDRNK